jgi:ATP-dependent Clp protease adaptor protein ClpS
MIKERTNPVELNKIQLTGERKLMLYNDDFNTFDYVIESLIEICDHDPVTAEQITLIVHLKGKGVAKVGNLEELVPMSKGLTHRGLTVSIIN